MSSFTRASKGVSQGAASAVALPGTRKWLDGSLMVSSGHAQLDALLGGGLQAGTVILLEEDVSGTHATTLARLFAAEGLAAGHALLVGGHDGRHTPADFLASLPLNVSRGSRDMLAAAAAGENLAGAMAAGEAQERTGPADVSGAGLTNAWQYRKYLPQGAGEEAPGSSGLAPDAIKFGHTYDLGRRIPGSSLLAAAPLLLPPALTPPSLIDLPPAPPARAVASTAGRAGALARRGRGEACRTTSGTSALMDAIAEVQSNSGRVEWGQEEGVLGEVRRSALRVGLALALEETRERREGAYATLLDAVGNALAGAKPTGAAALKRIVLLGLGGPAWPGFQLNEAAPGSAVGATGITAVLHAHGTAALHAAAAPLLAALSRLRRLVEDASEVGTGGGAVALVTMPTWAMPLAVAAHARAQARIVLKTHRFGEPSYALACAGEPPPHGAASTGTAPEFAAATGLLIVRRTSRPGACIGHLPDTRVWLLTRDKRKLVIEQPHLPPEEASSGGSAPAPQPTERGHRSYPSYPTGPGPAHGSDETGVRLNMLAAAGVDACTEPKPYDYDEEATDLGAAAEAAAGGDAETAPPPGMACTRTTAAKLDF